MKTKKVPLRMCIACREMKPKKEMLRIVKNKDGDISIDISGKAAGRGAYMCGNGECLAKLKKARLLNKVFSCSVPLEVYDKIGEEFAAKK